MADRIVLITGGSSGYGLAAAKAFVQGGDKVILAARDIEKLLAAQKACGATEILPMDVTSYGSWEEARDTILATFGRLDVLVNNAGGGIVIKEVARQTRDEIDDAISLNLTSVIYGCQVFAPVMMEQYSGTILNVSSVCATHCWPAWSVYAAAKAGVRNFSKGLYTELRPHGVRVTCVIPGACNTGFQSAAGITSAELTMKPEDVGNTIYYAATLPPTVVMEEVTVWAINQDVNPL